MPIVCEGPPTAVTLSDMNAASDSTPATGSTLLVILAAGLAVALVVMVQRRSATEQ